MSDEKTNPRLRVEISEHQQAQRELYRERDFINAVMKVSDVLVIVLDPQGRIVRFNRICERTTGYMFVEVEGRFFWDLFLVPEEIEPVKAVFAELLTGQSSNEYTNSLVTKEGHCRQIAWANTTLCDPKGAVEYIVGTGIDVTERLQAESALQESEERSRTSLERQIQVSTQMSQEIAVVNEEQALYKRAVALIKEQLGFYHTQLFCYDPDRQMLVLTAGYGQEGKRMLDDGYQLPAGDCLAGKAAALGTSVLCPDVEQEPDYCPNAYLPRARGELHIPIKFEQVDAHAQVMAVQSLVDHGFDGLIVVAVDDAAMAAVTREAMAQGCYVVSTNDLGKGNQTALIGFQDYENGYLLGREAGRWARAHLAPGETLQFALFGSPHLATIVEREEGILVGIRDVFPNIELVETANSADPASSTPIARRWLETWPDLHMILSINDSGALGAYAAVVDAGKDDANRFFIGGIDATDEALAAIMQGGTFQATIDQSPRRLGVLLVRTLLAAIAGQPYETKFLVSGMPVTRDNLAAFWADASNTKIVDQNNLAGLDLSGIKIGLNVIDLRNPFFKTMTEAAAQEAARLGVELLITDSKQVLGVLSVQSDRAGALDAGDQRVLEGLCGQIATAVKGLRLFSALKRAHDELEQRVAERTVALRQEIVIRRQTEEALRQAKNAAEQAQRVAEEARAAAEAANQAKSSFLANMSHEFRTPLNAILGFSELMSHDANLNADQQKNLDTIGRSGQHLLALINDVLELSKIEAGRVELQPESFDLHRMLLGLGEMFVLQTESKGLTLVFDLAPDVPQYVRTDQGKLRQVLINLLENAVKFTERGSVALRVRCRENRDVVEQVPQTEQADLSSLRPYPLFFEIEDTGVGIAFDELDKVFDVFVQTSSGRRLARGTGLGVPISREFVRLMGGDLRVDSQLGAGAVFRFDILVEPAEVADVGHIWPIRRVAGLKPGTCAPEGGPYRLLVAEDMETSRKLLVEILNSVGSINDGQTLAGSRKGSFSDKGRGFEIREAVNGQETIDIWQAWQPHLIWMDIRMPVMDGYEATRDIRAKAKTSSPIIVALTASAFEADRQKMLAVGCDDFIRKPFRETEIIDALTRHLGVQFVYEDVQRVQRVPDEYVPETPKKGKRALAIDSTMVASLAKMPPRWLKEMHQATLEGDWDWMMALILQVREREAGTTCLTADVLTELAYNFEHQTILELTERAAEI
ncbi:MAG: substrate-binding domain-containing protein [Anaerolineae bacterium]|nr:substrate-binding domain-containing protein [Anaerolineae bacterium]